MTAASAQPFSWQRIKRPDRIPETAVLAGSTKSDGDVYVGRNEHGVGKLNHDKGTMWNIWVYGASATQEGEILLVTGHTKWVKVKRYDEVPPNAVVTGHTASEGSMYACRSRDGEVGKLTLDKGKVYSMYYHGHWTAKTEGEILCVDTPQIAGPAPTTLTPAHSAPAAVPVVVAAVVPVPKAAAAVQPLPVAQEQVPALPSRFPELERLRESELQYLQDNPTALDDFIMELPLVVSCQKKAATAWENSEAVAVALLSREVDLQGAAGKADEASAAHQARLARVQELLRSRDEIIAQNSKGKLASVLDSRARASEQEAEGCLQKVLESHAAIDASALSDFRQQYLHSKIEKHTRLAVKERLGNGT